jgi:hypothetical protein
VPTAEWQDRLSTLLASTPSTSSSPNTLSTSHKSTRHNSTQPVLSNGTNFQKREVDGLPGESVIASTPDWSAMYTMETISGERLMNIPRPKPHTSILKEGDVPKDGPEDALGRLLMSENREVGF